MILDKVVVWIGDPDASRCLISVEQWPTPLCLHDKVLVDIVLLLDSIFNEDCMALHIIRNIVHETKVVSSMNSESSVETGMSSKSLAVRLVNSTNHMEMDSVSSDLESLSDIMKLNVIESCNKWVITLGVKEENSTILVLWWIVWATLIFDVSCEKTDFGSHVNEVISVVLDHSKMLELERFI